MYSFSNVPAHLGTPPLKPGTPSLCLCSLSVLLLLFPYSQCALCFVCLKLYRAPLCPLWTPCYIQHPTGTTHVAVGFLDLSTLCTGVAGWGDEVETQPSSQKERLRWVGVDSSPGCVAQALVVAQMLRSGAAVDQILQVPLTSQTPAGC